MNDYSLISKVRPFASKEGTKAVRYEITDNFLRMWFKYIHRNRSIVEIGNWKLLRKIVSDDYTTYTGDVLERYFRQRMMESMEYHEIGNWWDPKNKEDKCEINIIAISVDNKSAEIYEVKRNPERYHEELLKKKVAYLRNKVKGMKKYSIKIGNLSMLDM